MRYKAYMNILKTISLANLKKSITRNYKLYISQKLYLKMVSQKCSTEHEWKDPPNLCEQFYHRW